MDQVISDRCLSVASLDQEFYWRVPLIGQHIMRELITKGYFRRDPSTWRKVRVVTTIGVLLATFLFGAVLGLSWPYLAALAACAGPMLALAYFIPRRGEKGIEALAHIRGVREYLRNAGAQRLEQAPQQHFESLLPYAVALDTYEGWTKIFHGIVDEPPRWIARGSGNQGVSGGRNWDSVYGKNIFRALSDQLNSCLHSAPAPTRDERSSAGLFSGGLWRRS